MHPFVGMIIISLIIALLITSVSAFDILPEGDIYANEEITLQGLTNFNEENNILIEIFPASFGPTHKYDPVIMGGTSGIVPVLKTNNTSMNIWSFTFSTVGWSPDLYMVRTEVLGKNSIQTETYELLPAQDTNTPENHLSETISLDRKDDGDDEQSEFFKPAEQMIIKDTEVIPSLPATPSPLPIWLVIVGIFLVSAHLMYTRK